MNILKRNKLGFVIASVISIGAVAAEGEVSVNIPSMDADKALLKLSEVMQKQIMISKGVEANFSVPELKGEYSLTSALDTLLAGTQLAYKFTDSGLVIIEEKERASGEDEEESVDEEVVVTGTRLKNVDPASPRLTITREDIQRGGYSSVEDVLRSLPQNLNSASSLAQQLGQNEVGADTQLSGGFDVFPQGTTLGNSGVNLRGLGARSSLVLVNGRRRPASSLGSLGGFTDTSSIPMAQVERIEIITDGASAIYGADAVAGVVNIILRDDYEGVDMSLRSESAGNGGSLNRVDLGYTFNWDTGRLSASMNAEQTKPDDPSRLTPAGENGAGDFRVFGGIDRRSYGIAGAGEGSVLSLITFDGRFGLDGTPDQLLAGPNPWYPRDADGFPTGPREAGVPSVFREADLGPENDRLSLRLNGEQELGDSHTLSFDLTYDKQEDENSFNFRPGSIPGNPTTINGNLRVPIPGLPPFITQTLNSLPFFTAIRAENPNNPYDTAVAVGYDFEAEATLIDGLALPLDSEVENVSASIGLLGDLPFLTDWTYDVALSYSREQSGGSSYSLRTTNGESRQSALDTALAFQADVFSGTSEAIANNAALILEGLQQSVRSGESDTWQFSASVSGPVFSLPAGEAQLAVGVETRRAELKSSEDFYDVLLDGSGTENDPFNITRGPFDDEVDSVFAELSLPLLEDLPGIQELTLSVAARYETYRREGQTDILGSIDSSVIDGIDLAEVLGEDLLNAFLQNTGGFTRGFDLPPSKFSSTSPSYGLVWQVVDDVRVSATYGESFLAPLQAQMYGRSNIGYFPGNRFTSILREFLPIGGYISPISLSGTNPDLKAQTATTGTLQLAYTPSQIDGLSLSATYTELSYDNFIATINSIPAELLAENFLNLPSVFILGDTDTFVENARQINLSSNDSRTLDFIASYDFDTDFGQWAIDLNAVRTLETSRQLVPFVPAVSIDDTENGPSKWAGTMRLSWNYGDFNATWETTYTSGTTLTSPASAVSFFGRAFRIEDELPVNQNPQTNVPSYTESSFQVGYTLPEESGWAEGLRVQLGARNIFNPDAPFVDNFSGFSANRVSASGRVLYLNLAKDFDL